MENKNKRSELIFLYDVKYCNPNGDPMDANRPRIDEESGKCLVTDVRLKRTIRDYLFDNGYNGEDGSKGDIFVRDEDGKAVTGNQRAKSYKNLEEFKSKFIDVRLFGGVSAPKSDKNSSKSKKSGENELDEEKTDTKKTFSLTGPVQFGMGITLNKVKENFIKGTGAFATSETAIQKTFREEYNITYGLVGFHGVINENAGYHTGLKMAEDIPALLDAIWNGTKNLLTRSKKGHMPRLLIKINYREPNFFIGDLLERLNILPNDGIKEDELLDISNFKVETKKLNEIFEKYKDKISSLEIINQDERIQLSEEIIEIK